MEELSFVDADGVAVFYRRWCPTVSRAPRSSWCTVHPSTREVHAVARVAGEGNAVYALDLRGHGRTAASTGKGCIGPRGMVGVLDDVGELAAWPATTSASVHSCSSVTRWVRSSFKPSSSSEATAGGVRVVGNDGAVRDARRAVEGIRQAVEPGWPTTLDLLGGPTRLQAGADRVRLVEPRSSRGRHVRRRPPVRGRPPADLRVRRGDDRDDRHGDGAGRDRSHTQALPVLLLTGEADPVSNGGAQVRELEKRLRAAGSTSPRSTTGRAPRGGQRDEPR